MWTGHGLWSGAVSRAAHRGSSGRRLILPPPHDGQRLWIDRPERFLVVAAGTKAGKTFGAVLWLLREAWTHPHAVCWWVAPVYKQARIAYRLMRRMLNRIRGPNGRKLPFRAVDGDLEIELPNGAVIQFRSAEDHDNLYGEGVTAAVFDEASRAKEEAWIALRSTLTFTRGRCLLIANAKGKKNFFYRLWLHGNDPEMPEFASFRQPTAANPWIPPEEIESARRVLPTDAFRELYLAEFLDDAAGVFRGYMDCVAGELEPPRAGGSYVIGADFARLRDWSVFTVLDLDFGHVVEHIRIQGEPWTSQVGRLERLAERYNGAAVWADATGVGDPVCEALEKRGVWVERVKFTPEVKRDLVLRLQGVIDHQEITYPEISALLNELDVFSYQVTQYGNVRYSAPSGYHDDCVMSLALAVLGMSGGGDVLIEGYDPPPEGILAA